MEDNTPLNLEDSPKLFGLRYDQLLSVLISLIVSTQFYSWVNPIPFAGQDLRLDFAIFLALLGPAYALVTMQNSSTNWECLMNHYLCSSVLIPGPDPNPVRFLTDEQLPDFRE